MSLTSIAPGPDGPWKADLNVKLLPGVPPLPRGVPVAVIPQGPNKDQCPEKYKHEFVSSGGIVKSCILSQSVGKTKGLSTEGSSSGTPTKLDSATGPKTETGTRRSAGTRTGTGTKSGTLEAEITAKEKAEITAKERAAAVADAQGRQVDSSKKPDMDRLKSMIMSKIDSVFDEFKSSMSGGRRRRTRRSKSRSRR